MMKPVIDCFLFLAGLLIGATSWAIPLDPAASVLPFLVNGRLEKNVQFWTRIYTQYDTGQGLIHDGKYIDHIYEVIDLRKHPSSHSIREAKRKWKEVLLSVHRKQSHPDTLNEEEKKVYVLFQDVDDPNKFLNAAHRKRIRFQLGQKDRFIQGLYESGKYLPWMEEVFKKEGMPLELTRLPFVESSFNFQAKSKVGASGIWQFMRSTAKLFIQVNEAVDERNDPIRATEAAAKLLKMNFQSLKSWPLAVTAYNHGRKGMMKAVRRIGKENLEELVAEYRGRSFGFASSNFFAELLACIEVEKRAQQFFGKAEKAKAIEFVEVPIPDFIELRVLARRTHLNWAALKELNPGINDPVFEGKLLFPAGYFLRIPSSFGTDRQVAIKNFTDAYDQIPGNFKLREQRTSKYGTKVK